LLIKKLLSIIIASLILSGNVYATNSFETAFKKALEDHQYYFKYKGTTYTTDMDGESFDFFKHGYKTYREASDWMIKNYPNDKSFSCFVFKGRHWFMDKDLTHDVNGWKKIVVVESDNKKIKVVLHNNNECYVRDSYFTILHDNKETFDSRTNFFDDREHVKGRGVALNINYYIDKDYNNNGKQELFLDVGYAFGMPWIESYYLFEYDNNGIKLVKKTVADTFEEKLGISDHHKPKFEISEEELAKIIIEKFK
jgi:hypothetical protein